MCRSSLLLINLSTGANLAASICDSYSGSHPRCYSFFDFLYIFDSLFMSSSARGMIFYDFFGKNVEEPFF